MNPLTATVTDASPKKSFRFGPSFLFAHCSCLNLDQAAVARLGFDAADDVSATTKKKCFRHEHYFFDCRVRQWTACFN